MVRTIGFTFETILPFFKKHRIAAINWGFVAGTSQTNYPWESWTKEFTAEPEVWFHDVIRTDGVMVDCKIGIIRIVKNTRA